LLTVRAESLRQYLKSHSLSWREDSSNRSGKYLRNRVRIFLRQCGELHQPLIGLAERCRSLREWVQEMSPRLDRSFKSRTLADLPSMIARHSAIIWLRRRGVPSDEISPDVIRRLLTMCKDASSPARVQFPGGLTVRRRAGTISAES